ncbi:hypothetical protein DFQ29_007139, partial [Apophysomyces sp. BC1021]
MHPNDIILYKRRFKRQQQIFRKAEQDIDRMRQQEGDDEDNECDDDNDISSTSTSGSSYRQLPGNKRKRRQTPQEKANKRLAARDRQQLSAKKSIKPCKECLKRGRTDTAYTHSRMSNKKCPYHSPKTREIVTQRIGAIKTVCRKIGLHQLLNTNNHDDLERLYTGINELVSYTRKHTMTRTNDGWKAIIGSCMKGLSTLKLAHG